MNKNNNRFSLRWRHFAIFKRRIKRSCNKFTQVWPKHFEKINSYTIATWSRPGFHLFQHTWYFAFRESPFTAFSLFLWDVWNTSYLSWNNLFLPSYLHDLLSFCINQQNNFSEPTKYPFCIVYTIYNLSIRPGHLARACAARALCCSNSSSFSWNCSRFLGVSLHCGSPPSAMSRSFNSLYKCTRIFSLSMLFFFFLL